MSAYVNQNIPVTPMEKRLTYESNKFNMVGYLGPIISEDRTTMQLPIVYVKLIIF